ncbi:MAG: anhydro-N-acetylmuramic acid kinase [Candidatus Eremiobacteraeota bacterium]|nr:anhydro-N-acetylmuramic acid kinase [Candidatus Eremiobacteraeota bacterium]
MLVIGLMSGTSCDGVDAAIVDVSRPDGKLAVRLLAFETIGYPRPLREALLGAMPPNPSSASEICGLNFALGEAFAQAALLCAQRAGIDMSAVDLVGSHGHTAYHRPSVAGAAPPSTLQIGEGAVIAQRTGVPCVCDFRVGDVAAGGSGAPLAPYLDFALLASRREARAALNVGGIANVTLLPAACAAADVRAFDIGAGNMVIDECTRIATLGKCDYDKDGAMAAGGRLNARLLDWLRSHPYYRRAPPKTTGREEFGADYAREAWRRGLELDCAPNDVVATVTAATAQTIADAVPEGYRRVITSGGGAHNVTLMSMLRTALDARAMAPVRLDTSNAFGIDVDAKEAIAFAVLGYEAVHGRPNNVPSCTGAAQPVVLGKLVLASAAPAKISRLIKSQGR